MKFRFFSSANWYSDKFFCKYFKIKLKQYFMIFYDTHKKYVYLNGAFPHPFE